MARIVVVSPDGKRGSVPAENVERAKARGYRVVTEAEDHPVAAGLNSAASGLTFGLSDQIASPEARTNLKSQREQNPTASAAGNFVGQAVQAVLTPEVKGIGAIGNAMVQGGLAGIGPQISEAALENKPVNAELLAADMITGVVANTALHGVFVGGAKLAGAAAGKAGELAATEKVTQAAESMRASVMKKALSLDDDAYKYARANGLLSATNAGGVASLAGELERKSGALALEAMDDAAKIHPDLMPLRGKIAAALQEPGPAGARELRKLFAAVGDPSSEAIAAKSFMEDMLQARNVRESALDAAQRAADMSGGAVEAGISAGIFGGPKAAAYAAGAKLLNGQVKNKGSFLVDRMLGKIQEGKVLPRVLEGFKAKIDSMIQMAPGILGPFGSVLANASAQGADALLAVHTNLAKSEQGGDYMARLGMANESPEDSAAYGKKLAMLEGLETQREKFNTDIDKGMRGFFKGDSFDQADHVTMTAGEMKSKVKSLEQVLRDPATLANHTPGDVMQGAPGLTSLAGQQGIVAAKFLIDRAPKPDDLWKPEALRVPFVPAPGDVEKFARYAQAVENPRVVAINLARGHVNPEGIEVLQTLYPNLFAEVQKRVFAQLQGLTKPLPYAKQAALAEAFGPAMLGVNPQQVMLLQVIHQNQTTPQPGQEPSQGPSQDGRQMVNTNNNMQTQNQRLEGRK